MPFPVVHLVLALRSLAVAFATCVLLSVGGSAMAQIEPFLGSYSGSAQVVLSDGTTRDRDLSVNISETRNGFQVQWTTVTFRSDGRITEKSYEIGFVPSGDDGLFSAAMKRDLFGNEVQLNPMRGEPYVWGQISGETLTVYALFVDPGGGYLIHQYNRTLAEGGLQLDFNSVANGERQSSVSTFLAAD